MLPQPHARPDPLPPRFQAARDLSRRIAEGLSAEDQMVQSMPDASPVKWHLAHTTWFFETFVLLRFAPGYRVFHPAYSDLYNSYYNALGAQFPRGMRGALSRPSLEEVLHWRAHVEFGMQAYLAEGTPAPEAAFLLDLGLEHEAQHQELMLTDLKHALFQSPLQPAYRLTQSVSGTPTPLTWMAFGGGMGAMGWDGDAFAFDNERPRHPVYLQPFALAARPVSNGEFAAFMEDGGYARPEWWLAEAWAANQAEGRKAPLYWQRRGDAWWHYTHSGPQPIDPAAPVSYVSQFEADAYAHWAGQQWPGARLPTEAEWEHAAAGLEVAGNLLDLDRLAPAAASGEGLRQMFGDVWEWTSSAYGPHPGFKPFTGLAAEYNGKFMSGQMVLKGGSCLTPADTIRPSYRNFFPAHARWQCSGIRLARDAA